MGEGPSILFCHPLSRQDRHCLTGVQWGVQGTVLRHIRVIARPPDHLGRGDSTLDLILVRFTKRTKRCTSAQGKVETWAFLAWRCPPCLGPGRAAQRSQEQLGASLAPRTPCWAACVGTCGRSPWPSLAICPGPPLPVLNQLHLSEQQRPGGAEKAGFRPTCTPRLRAVPSRGSRVVKQSGPSWAIKRGSPLPTHPFPGCLPAWGLALPQERSLPLRSLLCPTRQGSACAVPAEKPLLTGFLPRKESLGSLGSSSAHCNQLRVTGFPCSRGAGSMTARRSPAPAQSLVLQY